MLLWFCCFFFWAFQRPKDMPKHINKLKDISVRNIFGNLVFFIANSAASFEFAYANYEIVYLL